VELNPDNQSLNVLKTIDLAANAWHNLGMGIDKTVAGAYVTGNKI